MTIVEMERFKGNAFSVTMVSNTEPQELPTSGADLNGELPDDATFAPISTIIVPSTGAVYIADEDGVFHKQ